jgi:hypothetical protein
MRFRVTAWLLSVTTAASPLVLCSLLFHCRMGGGYHDKPCCVRAHDEALGERMSYV